MVNCRETAKDLICVEVEYRYAWVWGSYHMFDQMTTISFLGIYDHVPYGSGVIW
jgi:hypothetical protein